MRHLVIVESPSKCKTIEGYLGNEYRVIATCGHFRGLNSLEQINTSTLEISFKTTKPKIVKFLKEEIGIAKSVFLATDDDREGEAIAWHICKVCKIPLTTPRIVFHEITKQAIQKAMTSPTTINLSRVMAQHTRQMLDVYIGFTISPLLWKAIQHTLSAGRCQTPALHMIAEQEENILQQKKETSFRVKGYFTNKQIEFSLERPLSQEEVEPFLSNIGEFVLEYSETKDVTLSPPPILTTSILQQKSGQLHMSPKNIMSSAQVLYEHGLITYMRTDQATYSQEFIEKAKKHLGNDFHSPRNKSSDGAHEGIRVTQLDIPETAFDKNTDRLYAFLYKYTLQTCMKPTLLCHKIYRTLSQGLYFIHTSVSVKEKGWSETVEKDWSSYLDNLTRFHCERIQADEKVTQEFHWNEAHLIRELEKNEIGRPSTYTHILESIKDKKYVELGTIHGTMVHLSQYEWKDKMVEKKTICQEMEEKNKLSLTPLGKEVNEFCYKHFEDLFNYSFTRILEKKLDEIEQGLDHTGLVRETISKIDTLRSIPIEPKKYPSFHAGLYRTHALIVKKGMYGYYLEYKDQSISLKEFDQEKITQWIDQQSISKEDRELLIKFKETNDNVLLTIDSEWSLRKGQYGPYLFYKTKKMKKPKFYTYPHSQKKEDIEEYIRKNIKT